MRHLALLLPVLSLNMASASPSFCSPSEQTVFNCTTQNTNKLVSVCAAKDLGKPGAYLSYYFGSPGKPELTFPRNQRGSLQAFQAWHYTRAETDYFELRFQVGDYHYAVFDYFNAGQPVPERRGVAVSRGDNQTPVAEFTCGKGATARLPRYLLPPRKRANCQYPPTPAAQRQTGTKHSSLQRSKTNLSVQY